MNLWYFLSSCEEKKDLHTKRQRALRSTKKGHLRAQYFLPQRLLL
jgi:hypothetical protein